MGASLLPALSFVLIFNALHFATTAISSLVSSPVDQIKLKIQKMLKNGILLPKLFWLTVRKKLSSDQEKLLKAENLQKFWDH